jgi:hypothetical protein
MKDEDTVMVPVHVLRELVRQYPDTGKLLRTTCPELNLDAVNWYDVDVLMNDGPTKFAIFTKEDCHLLMEPREHGDYAHASLYLNQQSFGWEIVVDNLGMTCLVARRK